MEDSLAHWTTGWFLGFHVSLQGVSEIHKSSIFFLIPLVYLDEMVWMVILQARGSSAKTWDKEFLAHEGPMFDGWVEVIKSRIEAQDGKTKEYTGVVGSLVAVFWGSWSW